MLLVFKSRINRNPVKRDVQSFNLHHGLDAVEAGSAKFCGGRNMLRVAWPFVFFKHVGIHTGLEVLGLVPVKASK